MDFNAGWELGLHINIVRTGLSGFWFYSRRRSLVCVGSAYLFLSTNSLQHKYFLIIFDAHFNALCLQLDEELLVDGL